MKALRLNRLERYIVPVLILVGWEMFSRSGALPAALLPAPTTVLWSWADWVFGIDGNTQTYSGHWIFDTAARNPYAIADTGTPRAAATASARRYPRDRTSATGSTAGPSPEVAGRDSVSAGWPGWVLDRIMESAGAERPAAYCCAMAMRGRSSGSMKSS